jgi:hypothetical protein
MAVKRWAYLAGASRALAYVDTAKEQNTNAMNARAVPEERLAVRAMLLSTVVALAVAPVLLLHSSLFCKRFRSAR